MYQHVLKMFSPWLQSRRYGRRQTVRLETSIVDKEFNHMMKFYRSATSNFPWHESVWRQCGIVKLTSVSRAKYHRQLQATASVHRPNAPILRFRQCSALIRWRPWLNRLETATCDPRNSWAWLTDFNRRDASTHSSFSLPGRLM